MKQKNHGAFWRGFGSVLSIAPGRSFKKFKPRDLSADATEQMARAWAQVGQSLQGAMSDIDREQRRLREAAERAATRVREHA